MPCDYKKYPPNWKTEIVPRILKRADNECEVCGLENGQEVYSVNFYLKKYGYKKIWLQNKKDVERIKHLAENYKIIKVVLTVAHLDHDELNHDIKDDRLKAMCQYCHLNYDAKEKQRRIHEKE